MIGLDEQVMQSELNKLGRNIDGFSRTLGICTEDFLAYEAGHLCRTLINITPPTRKEQSMRRIDKYVSSQFEAFNNPKRDYDPNFTITGSRTNKHGVSVPFKHKEGLGEYRWYGFRSNSVYGLAPQRSMLGATPDQLVTFLKTIPKITSSRGRIIVGSRGKQVFKVMRKVLTKQSTVEKAIAKIQSHIGRLKAAWMVGWINLGKPGPQVPQWIRRHYEGAKGLEKGWSRRIQTPGAPEIIIGNRATGADNLRKNSILANAVSIRSKAIVKDLQLYLSGVKKPDELKVRLEQWKNRMQLQEL